jgi:hypothetical protein
MTISLAQTAGEPARQATQGGDGPDPAALAARAAAELPADFVRGAATTAYQIEGAVAADGRRPCIWDTFAATPARPGVPPYVHENGATFHDWHSNLMQAHRNTRGPA